MDHWKEFERIAPFVADYFGVARPPTEREPTIVIPTQPSSYDYAQNRIYLPQNPNEFEFPEHVTRWMHKQVNQSLYEKIERLRLEVGRRAGKEGELDSVGAQTQRELMLCKSLGYMVAGIGALGYLEHQGLQTKVIKWVTKMQREWTVAQLITQKTGNEFEGMYPALGYGYAADAYLAKLNIEDRKQIMLAQTIEDALMILTTK